MTLCCVLTLSKLSISLAISYSHSVIFEWSVSSTPLVESIFLSLQQHDATHIRIKIFYLLFLSQTASHF